MQAASAPARSAWHTTRHPDPASTSMSSASSRPDLAESFNRFFRMAPASSEAEKNDVFFIRHDVYARELGFEPVRPDQRESDAYDAHSLHCLMRTAEAVPRLVGCARVVLTNPQAPEALLPFEKACRDSLDRSVIDPSALPRGRIAEVSRLAVLSDFRRRRGEQQREVTIDVGDFGDSTQPRFPYIPVGLYMASVMLAAQQGVEHLFTLTEPRLAEHFSKLGVKIRPIGAPVEHRGMRVPSVIHVPEVEGSIRLMIRPLWKAVAAHMQAA
jgi:N-acyl amino acid synthase of PEP-CTERM/exosortase system